MFLGNSHTSQQDLLFLFSLIMFFLLVNRFQNKIWSDILIAWLCYKGLHWAASGCICFVYHQTLFLGSRLLYNHFFFRCWHHCQTDFVILSKFLQLATIHIAKFGKCWHFRNRDHLATKYKIFLLHRKIFCFLYVSLLILRKRQNSTKIEWHYNEHHVWGLSASTPRQYKQLKYAALLWGGED